MHNIIDFLVNSSAIVQLVLFCTCLLLFWIIEVSSGLYRTQKKWSHAVLNAGFVATNIPVQFLIGLVFTFVVNWTAAHHFGVLAFLHFGSHERLYLFISGFCLLDFGEYIYHLLMHKIKRFWMFHVVHHSDVVVDVSTTLREHPGENLIRNSFTVFWVLLSGVPFWILILRQIIQIVSNVFAHINYRIPERLDRIIGLIFITPNLHHVHHHFEQPYTDCNYGDVLSVWDRLFGTFNRLASSKVVFGVDTFMDVKSDTKFRSLIKLPFGKYRRRKPSPMNH